jgi:urate oxidase
MSVVMGPNRYSKVEVRVVKVLRDGDHRDLRDLTVTVSLEGDFEDSYTEGDNRAVLPTDTMMRAVYALAKDDPLHSIEEFGQRLVEHFLRANPAAGVARVRLIQHPWGRISDHPYAFIGTGGGLRTATVTGTGEGAQVSAGIDDLLVLKATGSGFAGFLKDDYTLLEETDDRILATIVTADWSYNTATIDYTKTWEGVRRTLLEAFAERYSHSVQHSLWLMGRAVLEAFDGIERIHFALPNKHHLLVDLRPYGRQNEQEIFHAPDRPYGLIEGTVQRSG